ncbi:MAG TPA: cyclopropane-fatty-acyl-phospholipid synthase family protein [Thermoanaerobaculia bacterium]|nr:cyclopropane-fatty-acyl-phospholipid synthase family protein [Thermoanaerobaculia bacterium]
MTVGCEPRAGRLTSPASLPPAATWPDRLGRRVVLAALEHLADGVVRVVDGDGRRELGRPAADGTEATVTVHDPRFWRRAAFGGSIGVAEAYIDGWWSADDLVALLRIVVRNRPALAGLERWFERLSEPWERLRHVLRRNSRTGSRRNIVAHYDLGNDFFALFLDPGRTYSAALFEHPDQSLEEAQQAKLERLCRKLALRPGERVLEIGTGWGSFAEHAAREHGVHVTTTTISPAQRAYACERIARAGLADRVELLALDYRDLPHRLAAGRFDAVVSIEMIEAVGHRFLDTFFGTIGCLLAPHGRLGLQAITLRDAYYERALRSVDFIQRYIFPGSFIPAVSALMASVARSTDLALVHLEDIGPHYATTLHHWRRRLLAARDALFALGFDAAFLRLWEYYFAYCEAGFAERALGDAQLVLARPGARMAPILGALEGPDAATGASA